jgi:ATP-dependent protease HslVU (ClpYQ) peptidase subunit
MSIVMIVKNEKTGDIVVGSDLKICEGDYSCVQSKKYKVFNTHNIIVGYVGSFQGVGILLNRFKPVKTNDIFNYSTQFKQCLLDNGLIANLKTESCYEYIIATPDKILTGDSYGHEFIVNNNFYAIGSGNKISMGILAYLFNEKYSKYNNLEITNEEIHKEITTILKICEEYVPSTGNGSSVSIYKRKKK